MSVTCRSLRPVYATLVAGPGYLSGVAVLRSLPVAVGKSSLAEARWPPERHLLPSLSTGVESMASSQKE